MYAERLGAGQWQFEEVARGYFGDVTDYFPDGESFFSHVKTDQGNGTDEWLPAIFFQSLTQYRDPDTVIRLNLAVRQLDGTWQQESLLECSGDPEVYQGKSFFVQSVHTDRLGRTHFVASMLGESDQWLLGGYRTTDGTWSYYRTGLIKGQQAQLALATDALGNPYIAVRTQSDPTAGFDVSLLDYLQLETNVDPNSLCSAPKVYATPVLIDSYLPDDQAGTFDDADVIDELPYVSIYQIVVELDGSVHIGFSRTLGNHEVREHRVLSQCAFSSLWTREAISRSHDDGGFGASSDASMLIHAFNLGHAHGNGGRYDPVPADRVMVAVRQGTACSSE
jgi:hypothetical protein